MIKLPSQCPSCGGFNDSSHKCPRLDVEELARTKAKLEGIRTDRRKYKSRIVELETENKKLRKALEHIAAGPSSHNYVVAQKALEEV